MIRKDDAPCQHVVHVVASQRQMSYIGQQFVVNRTSLPDHRWQLFVGGWQFFIDGLLHHFVR